MLSALQQEVCQQSLHIVRVAPKTALLLNQVGPGYGGLYPRVEILENNKSKVAMSESNIRDKDANRDGRNGVDVLERNEVTVQRPPMYRVLMCNDDYTPVEFVIEVLQRFFSKSYQDAVNLTILVHNKGKASVGVFTREVAETKVAQSLDLARLNQHPLMMETERDE